MSTKDLAGKKIEDYNEVFADIYNTLLFGRAVLVPDGLGAGATESIYKTDGRDVNDQRRDILKHYRSKANLLISSLGIENQTSIDGTMPLRVMGYDYGTYRQQVIDGEKKISPVITIVLNFSDRRWQAAKRLHEMLCIDPEWRELSHPQAVLEFISAFTQDGRYLDGMQYLNDRMERGGVVTMCQVADALISKGERQGILKGRLEGERQGILKGRLEGRLEGKVELLSEMNFPISDISKRLNISEEEVRQALKQSGNL